MQQVFVDEPEQESSVASLEQVSGVPAKAKGRRAARVAPAVLERVGMAKAGMRGSRSGYGT